MTEADQTRVVIIGSGVIGSAVAYHLQMSGADVMMIDAGGANATTSSFGWINASFFQNHAHFALRVEGMAAYRRLSKSIDIPIIWCGSLNWEVTGAKQTDFAKELESLGYPIEYVDAGQFGVYEPAVLSPPDMAIRCPTEAAVDSGALAISLQQAAVQSGARVIHGVSVDEVTTVGGKITGVKSAVGTFEADQVLVAAGTGTQVFMKRFGVDIPMLPRPALVLQTQQVDPCLNHILVTEMGEIRQLPNGALLMPTSVNHQSDDSDRVGNPDEEACFALDHLGQIFPNLGLRWAQVSLAHRPIPLDGLPVVGAVADGLYVATMHSGITLGAIMGELIADEMMNGVSEVTDKWLSLYRPKRFQH